VDTLSDNSDRERDLACKDLQEVSRSPFILGWA